MFTSEVELEALVVTGVVGRVVVAMLRCGSLSYEAAGLVILTVVSVGLEFTDGRNVLLRHLKPRLSISSGILLGSVTLPLVLSSRLVQLLRLPNDSQLVAMAVNTLRFEFWLALACSTSILFLLMSFVRKQIEGNWICTTLLEYLSITVLLLLTPKQRLNTISMGLWGSVYILGGKLLFNLVLQAFPSSGTVGEIILVVEGIVLYVANAAALALSKAIPASHIRIGDEQHLVSTIVQGIILGILLMPPVLTFLYRSLPIVCKHCQFVPLQQKGSEEDLYRIHKAGLFYVVLFGVIFIFVPRWLGTVTGLYLSPVVWIFEFILQQPVKRLSLILYWAGVIAVPLPHLYRMSALGKVPKILLRKYYHIMVVFMFSPALLVDPSLLNLAFGVALAGFLVLEMIRVWQLPPFGHLIESFMTAFTDHRDSGGLIISHFSLLLGCSIPVWLNSGPGDRPLASFAGILSLGIGDTMASVIGYNFGSIRVSSKSKKTLEGTVSGIVSVLVCILLLMPMLSSKSGPAATVEYLPLLVASITGGVLEAYTLHLDNAFIPLIFYSLLCL